LKEIIVSKRNRNSARKIVAILAATLLGSVFATGSVVATQGAAPAFSLQTRDGQTLSLEDFRGEVVMINFWATWCGPCRQEMPLLEEIYQRYNKLGFTLLGVNVEEHSNDADRFLAETPVSFPILFDPSNEVSKQYGVSAMPSTVIVDREGNVRFLHHGYQPGYENEYQNQIRELVRE
jgi:peroxiredoxin